MIYFGAEFNLVITQNGCLSIKGESLHWREVVGLYFSQNALYYMTSHFQHD